jgi:hypothetical protein
MIEWSGRLKPRAVAGRPSLLGKRKRKWWSQNGRALEFGDEEGNERDEVDPEELDRDKRFRHAEKDGKEDPERNNGSTGVSDVGFN